MALKDFTSKGFIPFNENLSHEVVVINAVENYKKSPFELRRDDAERKRRKVGYTIKWRSQNKERYMKKWTAWATNKRRTNPEFRARVNETSRKSYRKKVENTDKEELRSIWAEKKRIQVAKKIAEIGREEYNRRIREKRHAKKSKQT